jgi:hypothetical protein
LARSLYLYPPGTGWPSYTPRHWVPFSSPPATLRATVEVFDPASTLVSELPGRCPRYITPLHEPSRKHRFQQLLYFCIRIHFRGYVFTEPFPNSGCLFLLIKICCQQRMLFRFFVSRSLPRNGSTRHSNIILCYTNNS